MNGLIRDHQCPHEFPKIVMWVFLFAKKNQNDAKPEAGQGCRSLMGQGGPPPMILQIVSPIQTRGVDHAQHITTCPPPPLLPYGD